MLMNIYVKQPSVTPVSYTHLDVYKRQGTATVKITGKCSYTGTITKTFKINPAKQEIQKLTAKSKAFFVR